MPLEEQLGRPLNPTLYAPQDWVAKFAAGNHFVVRVAQQDKISLLGEDPLESKDGIPGKPGESVT